MLKHILWGGKYSTSHLPIPLLMCDAFENEEGEGAKIIRNIDSTLVGGMNEEEEGGGWFLCCATYETSLCCRSCVRILLSKTGFFFFAFSLT